MYQRRCEYGVKRPLLLERINRLICSLFEMFGYRQGKVFSLGGIGNVLAVAFVVTMIIMLIQLGRNFSKLNRKVQFLYLFFLAAVAIQSFFMIFTGGMVSARYYLPFGWILILLTIEWMKQKKADVRRGVLYLVIAGTLLVAPVNTLVVAATDDLNPGLEEVIAFVEKEGYTRGFSFFWNANVVEELSNGKVKITSVKSFCNMQIFEWLTPKRNLKKKRYKGVKKFLLLTSEEEDCIRVLKEKGCGELFRNENYVVYQCSEAMEAYFYQMNDMLSE